LSRTTVGILGVGAIGGSIGLRARHNGTFVLGADRDASALDTALELGAIDSAATHDRLPYDCDVFVIATHLEPTLRQIECLARTRDATAALMMDVASVKVPVVRAARGLENFVATHPMAGTERSGVGAARADLFERRVWAHVPSGDPRLDQRVRVFIESMGAVPFAISADDHDRAVALTSHLPQLVAAAYAKLLRNGDDNIDMLRGPVASELLRISGMSFELWRDILRVNAPNIEPQFRKLIEELQAVADALIHNDLERLASLFGEQQAR
jgi:prephenate dehydrogenase